MNANPSPSPWAGPFGGVPPLDHADPAALARTVRAAMQRHHHEIQALATSSEPATFDNTIAVLELVNLEFELQTAPYWVHISTRATPELQQVERELAPEVAAMETAVIQNQALFDRICAVVDGPEPLSPADRRVAERIQRDFVLAGAAVAESDRPRAAQIHHELAELYTQFAQNVLADEQRITLVDDPAELDGLSASFRAAAAATATERGHAGKWAILNTRSAVETCLTEGRHRGLRERVWRAFTQRGDNGDSADNSQNITRILALRRERAALLGFESHAHLALSDQMARHPNAARALLDQVAGPAIARAREELADQARIAGHEIAPWDTRFYQEQVRRERYALDDAELKPYFVLDRLRQGMFWAAGELYGLSFREVDGLPVPHSTIRVFEVLRGQEHVALWYFDPYARPGKRSGAWMSSYRQQCRKPIVQTPIVVNVCNFIGGANGEPTLLSYDEARTLFHEFGHALHGMLSNVDWPRHSGTSVARDFVEFPSQINERWLDARELLRRFATHVETGAPIPDELLDRLHASRAFNMGFQTSEYVASALLDLELHLHPGPVDDVAAVERAVAAELELPSAIPARHRAQHFLHIFASEGYASMYYCYLWADALVADAAEAFDEAGSIFDPTTAQRLHDTILAVGGTVDAEQAFRDFRGRDPKVEPLLRYRGFAA